MMNCVFETCAQVSSIYVRQERCKSLKGREFADQVCREAFNACSFLTGCCLGRGCQDGLSDGSLLLKSFPGFSHWPCTQQHYHGVARAFAAWAGHRGLFPVWLEVKECVCSLKQKGGCVL